MSLVSVKSELICLNRSSVVTGTKITIIIVILSISLKLFWNKLYFTERFCLQHYKRYRSDMDRNTLLPVNSNSNRVEYCIKRGYVRQLII